jgi:rRNA maturation endonuclease Nob1
MADEPAHWLTKEQDTHLKDAVERLDEIIKKSTLVEQDLELVCKMVSDLEFRVVQIEKQLGMSRKNCRACGKVLSHPDLRSCGICGVRQK